ncbi:protein-tyrosine phosphatase-like protein [Chytriomyces sp. MP71]|nr:protein-tyrosine phosphatase-like protein [Chytriomyces sp. MP71]
MNTRNGLGVFYVTIVESHKAEVRRAFEVLAHPGSYPVLIHCSVGKDRTGVVIALIHRLIGTPDAVILADYLTSHGELQPIRASIEWEVSKLGMSPEEFAGCKEEALIQMLDHIDAKYGGVEGYLGAIGVSKNDQDKVRNNILEVK